MTKKHLFQQSCGVSIQEDTPTAHESDRYEHKKI